jgi:hypothetical protein
MAAVTKSYMGKGFLIYEEMYKYLVIYVDAVLPQLASGFLHFYQCSVSFFSLKLSYIYTHSMYCRWISQNLEFGVTGGWGGGGVRRGKGGGGELEARVPKIQRV